MRQFIRSYQILFHCPTLVNKQQITKFSTEQAGKSGFWSRWTLGNEWKIVSPFFLAILTYGLNVHAEKKETRKKIRLARINRQLSRLYGPLYGNRLVNNASYKAVMKDYDGLDKYLAKARKEKDAEMILRWRYFVINVLFPLDKEARDIICSNADLIPEHDYPAEFDLFLEHVARLQFVMELWKNKRGNWESTDEFTEEDFLEENNASGIRQRLQLVNYVDGKCRELRHVQTQLELEIDHDEHAGALWASLMKKFGHKH